MAVFSEKYEKFISLATAQDNEFENVLNKMISKLTEDEKKKCFKCEEFKRKDGTAELENKSETYISAAETCISVYDGEMQYTLKIKDLTQQNIENLHSLVLWFNVAIREKDSTSFNDLESHKNYTLLIKEISSNKVQLIYQSYYHDKKIDKLTKKRGKVDKKVKIKIAEEEFKEIVNMKSPLTTEDGDLI